MTAVSAPLNTGTAPGIRVTAASAAPRDRAAFLDALRAANVLTPKQLTKASKLAPTGSPSEVAGALVAAGLLTPFQTLRLLTGRTDGFHIGPYVLLDQVGRGSASRVYKARHRTLNRSVAVKILSSSLTRTAEARQTFQSDMRAAGRLSHTHIVTAYDANELNDRFYLVLEFVDGPNLDALVRARGPLPVGEACEYVRQAAQGLMHAHELGIVHRALKPTNLLVARPSASAPVLLKIADFGLARLAPSAGDFTAPEQSRDPRAVDHRADLYSLGCVLYFLLTGQPPFPGGTADEKVQRHSWEKAERVERLRPGVPPAVAAVVHRLLAKYPDARFNSAAELLVALDAACKPVAIPMESVTFEMPIPVLSLDDCDQSGGHAPLSSGSHPAVGNDSHWAHLTAHGTSDTMPMSLGETPVPEAPRPKAPGRGEPVPLWANVALLTGAVALALLGIGAVVKLMVK